MDNTTKDNRYLPLAIIIIGITLRFIQHFVYPSFNVDEIALGLNIKERSFIQLLYPLDNFQSAPPLYLWLQKVVIGLPLPFWISIKILSFAVSTATVLLSPILSWRLFQKLETRLLFILIISTNPFIVYNSLTVKQYGLDLLFITISLIFNFKNARHSWLFLTLWCLTSNIGLFFTAGYLLYNFTHNRLTNKASIVTFIKDNNYSNLLIATSPLLYIFYFSWFMQQNGAVELKEFMVDYWANSFIPLNFSIFKYIAFFVHGISVYFVSSFHIIGYSALILISIGFITSLKYNYLSKNRNLLIALNGIFVHIVLNILHLYPLGDRLYLYLAPIIIFFLIYPIDLFKTKHVKIAGYTIAFILLASYWTYTPYKENDVVGVINWAILDGPKNVLCSPRAYHDINSFCDFTDYYFNKKSINFIKSNSTLTGNEGEFYYISRVHHKFGHENKTADEEPFTKELLNKNKIRLFKKLDGYNIYTVNKI